MVRGKATQTDMQLRAKYQSQMISQGEACTPVQKLTAQIHQTQLLTWQQDTTSTRTHPKARSQLQTLVIYKISCISAN